MRSRRMARTGIPAAAAERTPFGASTETVQVVVLTGSVPAAGSTIEGQLPPVCTPAHVWQLALFSYAGQEGARRPKLARS
ncbi:hypothetical protein [Streptomyces sp. NPDC005281]|uniref:hypothetical protein n=1 Tax=Streptomyces sp. NPDC005281 TaxID=3155712 RepID=UPI0033BA0CB8